MEDRILLVTGASSDVGSELIRRVAERYDYIWAHYCHSESVVEKLQNELGDKILPIQADFTREESVLCMITKIQETKRIPNHIVHFPAISNVPQRFEKIEWSEFEVQIQATIQSIVFILSAFIPHMKKKKQGKIIFMLSSYVLGNPAGFQSSYVTVKYALLGLMKSLATEYADKGIQVNGVSPSMIETKFVEKIPAMVQQISAEQNPRKRNLTVEDVVPTFMYLLADGTEAITGQNIGITGGGVN